MSRVSAQGVKERMYTIGIITKPMAILKCKKTKLMF